MSTDRSADEVRAERDFLLNALHFPSPFGVSSGSLLLAAITGQEPHPFNRPVDEHDLAGVKRTLARAPVHLKPRMKLIIGAWEILLGWERPTTQTDDEGRERYRKALAEAKRLMDEAA